MYFLMKRVIFIMFVFLSVIAFAKEKGANKQTVSKYGIYIDNIKKGFDEVYDLYKKNQMSDAGRLVRTIYFDNFENLERPIAISVSYDKSKNMESDFKNIIKMVRAKKPLSDVKAPMEELLSELTIILPKLEAKSSKEKIKINYTKYVNNIDKGLSKAYQLYINNNNDKANNLIKDIYADSFKKLKRPIISNLSYSDAKNLDLDLKNIMAMIRSKDQKKDINKAVADFVKRLKDILPEILPK